MSNIEIRSITGNDGEQVNQATALVTPEQEALSARCFKEAEAFLGVFLRHKILTAIGCTVPPVTFGLGVWITLATNENDFPEDSMHSSAYREELFLVMMWLVCFVINFGACWGGIKFELSDYYRINFGKS